MAAGGIAQEANRWIANEQAKGAKISPTAVAVMGYPFAFSIKLAGVSLAWPNGFGFAAQVAKVRTRPWSLGLFKVDVTGGFTLMLPPGTSRPALAVAGETLRGHAKFRRDPVPAALDLSADTVSVTEAGTEAPAAPEVTVSTLTVDASRPETAPASDMDLAYDVALHVTNLSAQAIEANPLGSAIKDAVLHVQMLGIPPATPDAAGLKAWRDAGGTVEMKTLGILWGPLAASGSGTIALDQNMQPEGALTAHLSGFNEALDALAAAGWVKMSAASLAKLALGIASRPGPDGKPVVDTPLTIQDRRISVGPAKIGQMPELKID